ncbi:Disease resistance-like protein [Quillaja saponaria]|uniref:Disease resistance-like protein n=1 Tax=Quillaja saponaria TaxID=32244 RepID=A0AAD7QJG9_QUISA|nr:Disease resistance-like protein [Quillaja saponaria]
MRKPETGESSTSISSSFTGKWSHDAFVSFRGEDTRNTIVAHLFAEMESKGINTFKDDEELEGGEEISPTLVKAIEESRIAIVIFSETYASSNWCLDELDCIIKCHKEKNQTVLPVFYHVEPWEVREVKQVQNRKGSFVEAMDNHEKRLKNNKDKVDSWKQALEEAVDMAGFNLMAYGNNERTLIEEIIKRVLAQLNRIALHITDYQVGVEYRRLKVNSLLSIGTDNGVRMVGIHGMAGIGKTEIAKAVFNLNAGQFERTCFLSNVREYSIPRLQEILLQEILGNYHNLGENSNKGIATIKNRLNHKKVLLVLDGVDKSDQLKNLAGGHDWFGSGSRIIITTRNARLLTNHGVEHKYDMELLNDHEALQLVCCHGFGKREPDVGYEAVSNHVVHYCQGLPFALERIGSDLHRKPIEEWEGAMLEYERHLPEEIYDKLKRSFELLGHDEKKVFLDIACFFEGLQWEHVKKIYDVETYFKRLEEKSLVLLDKHKIMRMHGLYRRLGTQIVSQQSNNPWKRSRLWDPQEVFQIISENKGTDKIEGLKLDLPKGQEVKWQGDALKELTNLRFLILGNAPEPINLPGDFRFLEVQEYKILFKSPYPQISDTSSQNLSKIKKEQDQLQNLSDNEEQEEEDETKRKGEEFVVQEQEEEAETKKGETKGQKCVVLPSVPAAGGAKSVVVYVQCCSLERCNSNDFDILIDMLEGYSVKLVVQNFSSLSEDEETELLKLLHGCKVVLPTVVVEGRSLGGFKEVMELHKSGELRKILSTSTSVEMMNDNKEKTIYAGFDNCPLHAADDVVLLYKRCSSLGTCELEECEFLKPFAESYKKVEVREISLCKNHEGLLKPFQTHGKQVVLPIMFVKGMCFGGKIEVSEMIMLSELSDKLSAANNDKPIIFASFDHRKRIKQQTS